MYFPFSPSPQLFHSIIKHFIWRFSIAISSYCTIFLQSSHHSIHLIYVITSLLTNDDPSFSSLGFICKFSISKQEQTFLVRLLLAGDQERRVRQIIDSVTSPQSSQTAGCRVSERQGFLFARLHAEAFEQIKVSYYVHIPQSSPMITGLGGNSFSEFLKPIAIEDLNKMGHETTALNKEG